MVTTKPLDRPLQASPARRDNAAAIDLSGRAARSLKLKPAELFAVTGPLRITFPAHMTEPPAWLANLDLEAVDFPAFEGRTLRLKNRSLRVVGVGGDRVCNVVVSHPTRVVAHDRPSLDPIAVDWLDAAGNVVRRGAPDNALYSSKPRPEDVHIPANGSVTFSKPGPLNEPIWCRHYAAWMDDQHSPIRQRVGHASAFAPAERMESTPSTSPPPTRSRRMLDAYSDHVREKLKDVDSTRRSIPFDYESRFIALFATSNNPSIIADGALGQWAAHEFNRMHMGEVKTFVFATHTHVMHITLEIYRREDGRRSHRLVLADPNSLTQPHAIETSRKSEVQSWSIAHLLSEARMDKYFRAKELGPAMLPALIAETPRGPAKADAAKQPARSPQPLPTIRYFPANQPITPAHLSSFDLLGYHQDHVVDSMGSAPQDVIDAAVLMSNSVNCNVVRCDPQAVKRQFDLIRELFQKDLIGRSVASEAIRPKGDVDSLAAAVTAGRSDTLEHYRDGLASLHRIGAFTAREAHGFDGLFDDDELERVDAARQSRDPSKRRAAEAYDEICDLVLSMETSRPRRGSASSDDLSS